MNEKIIGIVGGVGPAAGLDLAKKIIDNTIAERDQDHLPVLLVSYPNLIEDRTRFLTGKSDINPAVGILEVIGILSSNGVSVIGIPCNTAHSKEIFDEVEKVVSEKYQNIQLVNMIEACVDYLKSTETIKKIGLLATIGTYKSGLYSDYLVRNGFEHIEPDEEIRQQIHEAIYNKSLGIKANSNPVSVESINLLNNAVDHLTKKGAGAVIYGCTEISLAISDAKFDIPGVDPTRVLARKLIEYANPGKLKMN